MKVINLIDVCLPEYFNGSSKTIYAIPIDGTITGHEVRGNLMIEWNASFDDEFDNEEDFNAALDRLFENVEDMDSPLFSDLEPWSEDDVDSVYAYFEVDNE